ncbi:MAG: hypothetical protein B7Z68_09670 [Acidobacteria bacterium 21-70-11]|nr:MAG: hypothetical protein B7Z68_09670 [Acidobacteria bacterium 21-70-11]
MAVAVAAAATVARGKDLKIASTWVAAAVPVDGTPGAWAPLLRPLGDPPLVIGVQNDGRYLCVHYPVGMGPRGVRWQPGQGEPPEGEETRRANSDRVANEVELIGPTKDDRQPVQLGPDEPVQAALGDDSGVMVLEMRVPLQPTEGHPLAVGAVPGATIALGLATERPKAGARGRVRLGGGGESGEGGPGDESGIGRGRGGFGGRGGYGGRGGMGGGMRDRGMSGGVTPAPLDVWLRVTLAKGPAQTPAS